MGEVITKGYLIHRQDYDVFDEIITIINEHNLKFTCFCPGTKKITSKNARQLDYGNYLELDFFYSPQGLSKFKKATIINAMHSENKKKLSLALINEYFYKYEFHHDYAFYQQCIVYMNMHINDNLLILFILVYFYKINGLCIDFNQCVQCGADSEQLFIDLKTSRSYCYEHAMHLKFKYSENATTLLKQLFTSNYDLMLVKTFDLKEIKMMIRDLSYYLHNATGIFLESLRNLL